MKIFVGSIIAVVLSLLLIPLTMDASDSYDEEIIIDDFASVSSDAVEEGFLVNFYVEEVKSVTINGDLVPLDTIISINTPTNNLIILEATATDVGDEVVFEYSYIIETEGYLDAFVSAIPIIFIVIVIGGIVFVIRNN